MGPPGRLILSLLGPPNVGKSTLAAALATTYDAIVIRPRDAIRQAVRWRPGLAGLFDPVDDLGWTSDYALAFAVRLAVDTVPRGQAVLLENLPWDALQLADLDRLASDNASSLVVLLLDAPDDVLRQRGSRRRVCQTCERDPGERPRQPARATPADSDRCAACGGPLTRRPDDESAVLAERLRRSRHYLSEIDRYAPALGVAIHRLDGTGHPDEVHHAARAAVASNPTDTRA